MDMTQEKTDALIIEQNGKESESSVFNEYMKRSTFKAQMVKDIGELQDQIDYLRKEFDKVGKSLGAALDREQKAREAVDRAGRDLQELSDSIKREKKKEYENIESLQRRLNRAVGEYNAESEKNKEKARVLDQAKIELEEREEKLKKEHNTRLMQYKQTEKDLNGQLESLLAEKKKLQENTKVFLTAKDEAEKAQNLARKHDADAKQRILELSRSTKEFQEYKDREIEKLNSKDKELQLACDTIQVNSNKVKDQLRQIEAKENTLLEREADIKTREKVVGDLIKRYKLEKQINDNS